MLIAWYVVGKYQGENIIMYHKTTYMYHICR